MQSRRSRLPTIEPLRTFAEVVARDGVALADADGSPPSLTWPNIVVGPEGGWSEAERGTTSGESGWPRPSSGSETAAVAAGALLVALREGLVTPSDRHSPR